MAQTNRRKWFLYGILICVTLGLIVYVVRTIPFGSYDLQPDNGIAFTNGTFEYRVPLDRSSPWPRFRNNSQQTGRTAYKPTDTAGGRPWVFQTGKGIFSSPVIDAEGTVYIGSADQYFYAIDRNGRLKWKFATGEIIDSAALLDDTGRVYFGSGDAHVYALNRRTGTMIWKSAAHSVEAVQAEYGLQTYNVNWFEGNMGMLPGGQIIAPNDNYLTYALNRDTGEREIVFVSNEMNWSLPAVNTRTNRMFSGSQFVAFQNVFAFNTQTGENEWVSGGLGSNSGSPLLTSEKENAAVIVGGFDGIVRAYAQDSGKELWQTGTRDHIYASPAQQADGTIIQPSADGTVYALHPEDGHILWAYDTLEPIRSSPAIDGNGVIYVGSGEGKLFAINPDGTLRWAYQCISDVRNDMNASPGLGFDGIYIAGESGEIFFIPYDYPLSVAGRNDPRAIQGPGEILPDEGIFLVWTGPFGSLQPEAPEQIDANQPITFSLFVRHAGDTVLSAIDPDTLQISVNGTDIAIDPDERTDSADSSGSSDDNLNSTGSIDAPLVLLAAHKRFVSIIPQEFWPTVMDSDSDGASGTSGEVRVRIQGHIIVDQSRFGLKFYGGDTGAAFDQTFTFQLNDAGSIAGDLPYRVARNAGEPAGVIEISRLAAPNPTMLPSWNQIGFDSLHYLAGFVESDGHRAVLWVIPGKLDEATGETVVAPELKDRFALNADYANGLLSMHAYTPFLLSFIGSWDMPFAAYRLSTRVDPTTGAIERRPELNALVLGDELEFYGKFLKIMGMTDFWTGHMPVFGGANADRWHTGQVRGPTAEVGTVQLTVD
ncbi:MAG: PQQ-binding-like beta-propeller repeat protein, partial [Leptospiraceae bacterium]|nr:PQQ-binding-like beta-propeller repeat protein [Leptospiraceae bacterium]